MPIRIVAISDTHNQHDKVILPDGDVLIHAGDSTMRGTTEEVSSFSKWFREQPYKYKCFVAGNHDWLFQNSPYIAQAIFYGGLSKQEANANGLFYLEDEFAQLKINDRVINVYGSPHQPEFCNWAFNLSSDKLEERWSLIPEGLDILITHSPAYRLLDTTTDGDSVGCMKLRIAMQRAQPKLSICGHIHEGYGVETWNNTTFANAAICTFKYKATNLPIVFDIDDDSNINQVK